MPRNIGNDGVAIRRWSLLLCALLSVWQAGQSGEGYTPVDLRPIVNMGFKDSIAGDARGGWTDAGGNDMRFLPVGKQSLGNVEFDVIDPKTNGGKSCLVLYGSGQTYFPVELEAKRIEKKARSIYFLHGAAYPHKDAGAIYTICYADGKTVEIPIRGGQEIGNWWEPKDGELCRVAWHGPNLAAADVGLLLYAWQNPHPDTMISSIRFTSTKSKMTVAIAGVTLSDGDARLPEPKKAANPVEDESLQFQEGKAATIGMMKQVGEIRNEDALPPLEVGKNAYVPGAKANFVSFMNQYGGMNNPEKLPMGGVADVSFLNDKPAGAHGRLVKKDGRLVFADGTPARFLSTCATYSIQFPRTMEEARQRAKWLAANGINFVRLHHFAHSGKDGESIFNFWEGASDDFKKEAGATNRRWQDTRQYDQPAWERFDMFLAALKEEGIYTNISAVVFPWVGHREAVENDIPPRGNGYHAYRTEGAQIFIQEYMDKIDRYWKDLLGHKNPHTGLRYADDPAIASVEIINEDSIFWRGCDPNLLSAYYSMELHERWNNWLGAKYGTTEAVRKAWGDDAMEDWETIIKDLNFMKKGRTPPEPKRFTHLPAGFTTFDLAPAINSTYKDEYKADGKGGWTDNGKDDDMRFFPVGKVIFLGVPFEVNPRGPTIIADVKTFPPVGRGKDQRPDPRATNPWPTSAVLPASGKARTVHFLHTAGWMARSETPVFFYDVNYADNSKGTIEIRRNQEISDWTQPVSAGNTRVAWTGTSLSQSRIGLSLFSWNNPHPDKVITSITARILDNPATVCLIGITFSDTPIVLPSLEEIPTLPEWKRYVRLLPYQGRFESKDGWTPQLLQRGSDQVSFLYEVQTAYLQRQAKFIREEIGFKGLVLGSNWKTPAMMQAADHYSNAQLDILDTHNYGSSNGFMRNPGAGTLTSGLIRVLGMPFMISEYYPRRSEEYRLCYFPMISLYGQGLNGWEFPTQFATRRLGWGFYEHWDEGMNYPMDLCQYPAMALAIRRGDLKEAPIVYKRMMSKDEIFLKKTAVDHPYNIHYLAIGKVGTEYADTLKPDFLDQKTIEQCWDRKNKVLRSATGELEWDYEKGISVCRTERTQGAVGFLSRTTPIKLPAAELDITNPFAAVWLSSLDGKPMRSSQRVLVTLSSRCGTPVLPSGVKTGTYRPVTVESVVGRIVMHSDLAANLKVFAVDWDGKPLNRLETKRGADSIEFNFDTLTFKGPYLLITTEEK